MPLVELASTASGGAAASRAAKTSLFTSTRSGVFSCTWTARAKPPLASGVWGGMYVPGAARPTVVAVGPAGSAYTRDDGATWVPIDSSNYWSVGFASPRAGWAVGTRGRITRLSGF